MFAIDGGTDINFLSRIFDKLLINFTWWINREDAAGNNLFEGGFLGLDNIGPIDRSHLPAGFILEQSDGTGWMGFYAIAMGTMAVILNPLEHRPACRTWPLKFLEHFAEISDALDGLGLWDDTDGLYYDRLKTPGGEAVPVRVRSMVGIIPALAAAAVIGEDDLRRSLVAGKRFADFMKRHEMTDRQKLAERGLLRGKTVSSACCSASAVPTGWNGDHQAVRRASSCRRTAWAISPITASIPTSSRSRASPRASTTSRPNPPRPCSAGTRTGAVRCGSR